MSDTTKKLTTALADRYLKAVRRYGGMAVKAEAL